MDRDQLYQLQGLIDAVQIAFDAGASREVTARALMCISEFIGTMAEGDQKD